MSDSTDHSPYQLQEIDYIDFCYLTEIRHSMENIAINYGNGKQKIIYSRLEPDGETSQSQVFLNADAQKVPFGYRCPPNTQIQLVKVETDSKFYWVRPLHCQPLTE